MRLSLAHGSRAIGAIGLAVAFSSSSSRNAFAQTRAAYPDTQLTRPRVELFGQLVSDVIYDFYQSAPASFDVVRPTQLPAFSDEFGRDGRQYFSVRPTRFGVRTAFPTKLGRIDGIFDWDLSGTSLQPARAGFALVRAYASLGKWGVGQYDSPFMDIGVFPSSLEYWGPSGMVFFRNVQVRYMPIQGASRVTVALERPGASGDRGDPDNFGHLDLENVVGRYPWPDLSVEARLARGWGYVKLSGIARGIHWDDLLRRDTIDLDGSAFGWGLSLSSNIKTAKHNVVKAQITYGEAIESYISDAPFDIGIETNSRDHFRPVTGKPLPVLAGTAFYDHTWNSTLTTSLGYSGVRITNSDGQTSLAFHSGQYALVNLLYSPEGDLLFGGELQWGHRKNEFDGFGSNDLRIQLTARVNYSMMLKEQKENDNGK